MESANTGSNSLNRGQLWAFSAVLILLLLIRELIKDLVNDIKAKGVTSENIYFLGFSQGACLALEYVTRHAEKHGGVVAFTGGLIGDHVYTENYNGDFLNTPVFISTGSADPHVPVERVRDSAKVMKDMHADVIVKIYDNRPHTISADEIKQANDLIFI